MTGSPYDMFDASSLHGLHLKKRLKVPLKAQDLPSVIRANPGIIADKVTRDLFLEILDGELGAKRGRPKKPFGYQAKLFLADMVIEERAEEIRESRKLRPARKRRIKGEPEPVVMAADEIAPGFSITGHALLNAISAQKTKWDFRE